MAATEQCLGMIAEINAFSVSDEILRVIRQIGRRKDFRLFQSRGPAAAIERSPTVTRRDGRTSRRLEVDERSRPRRLVGRSDDGTDRRMLRS